MVAAKPSSSPPLRRAPWRNPASGVKDEEDHCPALHEKPAFRCVSCVSRSVSHPSPPVWLVHVAGRRLLLLSIDYLSTMAPGVPMGVPHSRAP